MNSTVKQLLIETGADGVKDIEYDNERKKWIVLLHPVVRPMRAVIEYQPQEYNSFKEVYEFLTE